MTDINSAAVDNNGTKKAPEAPQLTLPHPGETTTPATPPKPGISVPVGHSGTLVRIDNWPSAPQGTHHVEDTSRNLTVEVPVTKTGPDAPATTTTAATDSPRRCAGEFDTAEKLEAKYQGLLKTTTTAAPSGEPGDGEGGDPNSDGPSGSPTDDKGEEFASANRDGTEKTFFGKGFGIAELEREFDATNGLSEESYAELEQVGLGKDVMNSYTTGRTTLLNSFISEVKGLAGGGDGYRAVTEQADKGGLTDTEKESYNRVMNSEDEALIKLTVSGLVAKYWEEEEVAPELITGKASSARREPFGTFDSTRQVTAATKDPHYGRSPTYTRAVERKVAWSRVFGS